VYNNETRDEVINTMTDLMLRYEPDYWILDNTRVDSRMVNEVLTRNRDFLNQVFQFVYVYPQSQQPLALVLKVNKEWLAEERARRNEK